MATWTLHIVGQEAEDEVRTIGAELVKVLEDHGHSLVSAVLGTDAGVEDVPVAVEEETPDVPVDTPPELPA